MLRKTSCFLCSGVRQLDPSERVVWALETSRISMLNEVEFGEDKEPLLRIIIVSNFAQDESGWVP